MVNGFIPVGSTARSQNGVRPVTRSSSRQAVRPDKRPPDHRTAPPISLPNKRHKQHPSNPIDPWVDRRGASSHGNPFLSLLSAQPDSNPQQVHGQPVQPHLDLKPGQAPSAPSQPLLGAPSAVASSARPAPRRPLSAVSMMPIPAHALAAPSVKPAQKERASWEKSERAVADRSVYAGFVPGNVARIQAQIMRETLPVGPTPPPSRASSVAGWKDRWVGRSL